MCRRYIFLGALAAAQRPDASEMETQTSYDWAGGKKFGSLNFALAAAQRPDASEILLMC